MFSLKLVFYNVIFFIISLISYLISKKRKKAFLNFLPKNVENYEGKIVKKDLPHYRTITYDIKLHIKGQNKIIKSIQYAEAYHESTEYKVGDIVNTEYYINPLGKPEVKIIDDNILPVHNPHNAFSFVLSAFFLFLGLIFNNPYRRTILPIFLVFFVFYIIYNIITIISITKKGTVCNGKLLKKELIWGRGDIGERTRSPNSFFIVIDVNNKKLNDTISPDSYSRSLKVGETIPVRLYKNRFLLENSVQEMENKKNKK